MARGSTAETLFCALAISTTALTGCGDDNTSSGGEGGTAAQSGAGGAGGAGDAGGSGDGGDGGDGGSVMATGDWSCVGDASLPVFNVGPPESLPVSVRSYLTAAPLEGVRLRACDAADPDCETPASEELSDAEGLAQLDVPAGTMHYVEAWRDDMPEQLFVLTGPPSSLGDATVEWTPLSQAVLNSFLSLVDLTQDPERGMIAMRSFDCAGERAAGVTYEVDTADASSVLGYFTENGVPDLSLTSTTTRAEAGMVNAPIGVANVTTRAANGDVVDTRKIVVRAGAISSTFMTPLRPQADW